MNVHKTSLICACVIITLLVVILPARAQAPLNKAAVEQEQVQTECGFFEALKSKGLGVLPESHSREWRLLG